MRWTILLGASLVACGTGSTLELYDATETTTNYQCWNLPAPDPIQLVVGMDDTHLYTCDEQCDPIKVEIASSNDGRTFKGGVNTSPDSRGCEVHSTLTAEVTISGDQITITEHSIQVVSEGCDRPGTCTQDATVVGTKRK